jgi:acyl-CoA thioesterase-1
METMIWSVVGRVLCPARDGSNALALRQSGVSACSTREDENERRRRLLGYSGDARPAGDADGCVLTRDLRGRREMCVTNGNQLTTLRRDFYGSRMIVRSIAVAAQCGLIFAEPVHVSANPLNRSVTCAAPSDLTRLDYPLTQTAKRVTGSDPIIVVAIGSSSTAGAGASSSEASYPSRLLVELRRLLPHNPITVLNRGSNGEETREMVERFERDVISEHPDLVLWQVGTNVVLRDHPLGLQASLLHEGLSRLKATGSDVILIDPQFAPKVLEKSEITEMIDLIVTTAKIERVNLFHRYNVMRYWRMDAGISFADMLSADQLHMNDWSYDCLAKLLSNSIADAATRTESSPWPK